jgi:hypothetical protein
MLASSNKKFQMLAPCLPELTSCHVLKIMKNNDLNLFRSVTLLFLIGTLQFATQYKINSQFAWIYLSRNSKTSLLLRVEVGLFLAM